VHEDNPGVTSVCFSPNGRFVLAHNLDNSIRLWDYKIGQVKKTYQGHKNSGYSIGGSFGVLRSSRGHDNLEASQQQGGDAFVASASEDGDIVMWDVQSKQIVQRISQAHNGVCFWVDINGDIMASAGEDRAINVFKNQLRGQDEEEDVDEATAKPVNGHGTAFLTRYHGTSADEPQRDTETGTSKPVVKQEDIKKEEEL
jgi:COMPASS component SWD3